MSSNNNETRRRMFDIRNINPITNQGGRRQNIATDRFKEIFLLFKDYNNTFRTYQSNYNSHIIEGSHDLQLNYESNNRLYHETIQKIIEIIKLQSTIQFSSNSPSLNEHVNTAPDITTPEDNSSNIENDIWRNIFPFYIIEPTTMSSTTTTSRSFITVDEINQHIDYVIYNEEQEIESCPISHDNFINGETICKIKNCGHIFKIQHLFNWLRINATCPVCRTELISSNDSDTMFLINEFMRNVNISI